jgi:hypothetical protein
MQEFRLKNKCRFIQGREKHLWFRLPCNLSGRSKNCKFQLLALKTTSAGYHVYTFGQHNHPVAIMPRSKWKYYLIAYCLEKKFFFWLSFITYDHVACTS